jgi:uncharacterized protein YbjT (DUF2867 family)
MGTGDRQLSAVVVGATGLVGARVVALLLEDPRFGSVTTLVRRRSGTTHVRLREHVVDLEARGDWVALVRGDVLVSALGTTVRAAGSQAAQYRVDHDMQLRVAEAARANGVPTCVLVSSAGASPASRVFYSRMKGELERDVVALAFPRTRILRPGLLDGERTEARTGERWALRLLRPLAPVLPAVARPIPVVAVARAAITAALDPAPGPLRLEPDALFRLGRSR